MTERRIYMEEVEQHILQKDMTIEIVCNYLKDNN